MNKLGCFPVLIGKKKKVEVESRYHASNHKTLEIAIEPSKKSVESQLPRCEAPLPKGIVDDSNPKVKAISLGIPVGIDLAKEVAYEGEDEHEEMRSITRDFSDYDLQAHDICSDHGDSVYPGCEMMDGEDKHDQSLETYTDLVQSGHVSDPGIRKAEIWASPMLIRSCSNLETRKLTEKMMGRLPLSNSQSSDKLLNMGDCPGSPAASVMTRFSADRVILKKHSSSQVLPSRSRRLWWKLFLWSHRNAHRPLSMRQLKPSPAVKSLKQPGGYSSDTVEPIREPKPGSSGKAKGKAKLECVDESRDWPLNQWVAFTTPSSSFNRVEEWVKDLDNAEGSPGADEEQESGDEAVDYPPSPEMSISHARDAAHLHPRHNTNLSEEMLHANNVIQSLNSSSSVAHISGMGLKVVPAMSVFVSLKSVNLSGNSITRIAPGSLPKGLHILNLSKNKINAIEGLRELTRLRALDLSYNRISRIGHGLSNCTLIKELFLAGNKISDVEGLHRLLKLTVLDLSFNKITTTKALGQLVANYNTLRALNLLGNPIQSNIGEEQLRKAVCSLLPKLAYLNKQLIKQQRAREVLTDSVTKAALGSSGGRGSYRRTRRVTTQSSSGASRAGTSGGSTSHRSKSRPKGQLASRSRPAVATR
ncbi:hypothetical protein MLD38_022428 [Melastoma candidum]|uniref:Uncharacterized protein n=1 Tax=Melastoma candidum TaxID=119954 RepID=A0ACB9QL20_9MYRT|nr:hypothetical protein MLD38_022428 [Melastoma candidum]